MINEVAKWKNSLEIYVEDELGKMPCFDYKKSSLPMGVPWRVSYKNKKPIFWVYEHQFDKWFFNYLNCEDDNSKELGLGRVIFSLVHDLIHLYQIGHLAEKKGIIKHWLYRAFTHIDWVEGLAQLYTFKACNRLYTEAKQEDFNLLKNQSVEDFITRSLESKKYKKSVSSILVHFLSKDTKMLRGIKEIGENEFSFSKYPFETNKEIVIEVQEELLSNKDIDNKKISPREIRRNPYTWGAYQLSKLISKRIYNLDELIQNPLTNKELKKLVES